MPLPAIAFGAVLSSFFATLARFLIPYLIIKLAFAIGLTAVSITGTIWLVDYIETTVITQFNSIPGDVGAIAIRAGMLDAFAIIFNAWVLSISARSLMGAYKRFRIL